MNSELQSMLLDPKARLHFVGVGGTGMSALAQYRAFGRGAVSGSDRSFDQGEMVDERNCLEKLGVALHPQDGSGVAGASLVIVSTAVEDKIPDVARARELGIRVIHRADLLAAWLTGESIAVAGTSGKSTVTAMVFEILAHAERDPGLITGGRVIGLMREGHYGNGWYGKGPLVVEADESDGTLVKHSPLCGLLLNLHRDHMEPEKVLEQFRVFRGHVRGPLVVSDDSELAEFWTGAIVFGFGDRAAIRGRDLALTPFGSTFDVEGVRFAITHPGRHNAWNALAATATCHALGVPLAECAAALAKFSGVHRRFEIAGNTNGIEVVDDFAHNPQKIEAVLEAARARAKRVLAYFQPHGFAPMRFLRADITRSFARALRPEDRLWFAPIYFAGGTVAKDISSEDLIAEIRALGAKHAEVAKDRGSFLAELRAVAKPGDLVLIMGARDPTLSRFAREVAQGLR